MTIATPTTTSRFTKGTLKQCLENSLEEEGRRGVARQQEADQSAANNRIGKGEREDKKWQRMSSAYVFLLLLGIPIDADQNIANGKSYHGRSV